MKIRLSRYENDQLTCPQHACATCAAAVEDPTSAEASRKGKMFRCVRCPVAYHVGDFCIAAGSKVLGMGPSIVCGDHLEAVASLTKSGPRNAGALKPLSVLFCFTCGKSGPHIEDKIAAAAAAAQTEQDSQLPKEKPLICCSSCPAAYHKRCLPAAQAANDSRFTCQDCSAGKRPLYGDIVWVKIGIYRWWPCEIYHPENLPTNIRKIKHGVGEFAVRFFGTGEFYWLNRGRCFHYQYGDTSFASGNALLIRQFNSSITEVTAAYDEWVRFKETQSGTQRAKVYNKPVPFKFIRSNIPVGNVEIPKVPLLDLPKCDCKADEDNPCSTSECVNVLTLIECHPSVCFFYSI